MGCSEKKLILFAGVNGSGKTTLYNIYPSFQSMPRINTDEIGRNYGDWNDSAVMYKAGREAVTLRKKFIREGISFNQETTLCGKTILKSLYDAKKSGYVIEIYYVCVDSPEICKRRIAERVKKGGHGIPDSDVDRRYVESLKNIREILPVCDFVSFYDNTFQLKIVAEWSDGKIQVLDPAPPNWLKTML